MLTTLPLLAFPLCLALAALSDARRYIIPNELSLALIISFLVAFVFSGLGWAELGQALALFALVLSIGMALWALGYLGAGDVKLLAAIAPWLGWADFANALLMITVCGGALCLGFLGARKMAHWWPRTGLMLPGLARLGAQNVREIKIPYGVAIAVGAMIAFPEAPLFEALIAR